MKKKQGQVQKRSWIYKHLGGIFLGFILGLFAVAAIHAGAAAVEGCTQHFQCAGYLAENYPEGYTCANGNQGVYSHCRWEGTPQNPVNWVCAQPNLRTLSPRMLGQGGRDPYEILWSLALSKYPVPVIVCVMDCGGIGSEEFEIGGVH